MPDVLEKLALRGMRRLPPERAHKFTLRALEQRAFLPWIQQQPLPGKAQQLMGLDFPNQVGIAAGLDKDGQCINGLVSLGVGFIELGGVTPLPQSGNSGNRVLRLHQQQGMINRLGFNNLGCQQLAERIRDFRCSYHKRHGQECRTIIGVNIGKNATTALADAAKDYCAVLEAVHSVADYATINISSPNTPGLRDLQQESHLAPLLQKVLEMQERLSARNGKNCPLLVKLSPDSSNEELLQTIGIINKSGIAGVIASNTSSRHAWQAQMAGGISGRPLAARASEVLAIISGEMDSKLCLIACGGIDSQTEMNARLARGADLVQLYTALVYKGSSLISELVQDNT